MATKKSVWLIVIALALLVAALVCVYMALRGDGLIGSGVYFLAGGGAV